MMLIFLLMSAEFYKLWLFRESPPLFGTLFVPLSVISSFLVMLMLFVISSYSKAMLTWRGSLARAASGEDDLKMAVFKSDDEMSRFSASLGRFLAGKVGNK